MVKFDSHIYKKLIWSNKNTFHWVVETGLKDDFIMYYFLWRPSIMKTVNCFCPLVLSICQYWELLIANPHRPLCFKKIRTTTSTAFLNSNTVVLNPYNHSTTFIPQSFAPLSQIPGLFNRSVAVWYSNTLWPSDR